MYNRSEIFKRAWVIIRSGVDKSTAFRAAWFEAKITLNNDSFEIVDEFDIHQQEINDELYTMAVEKMARRSVLNNFAIKELTYGN